MPSRNVSPCTRPSTSSDRSSRTALSSLPTVPASASISARLCWSDSTSWESMSPACGASRVFASVCAISPSAEIVCWTPSSCSASRTDGERTRATTGRSSASLRSSGKRQRAGDADPPLGDGSQDLRADEHRESGHGPQRDQRGRSHDQRIVIPGGEIGGGDLGYIAPFTDEYHGETGGKIRLSRGGTAPSRAASGPGSLSSLGLNLSIHTAPPRKRA